MGPRCRGDDGRTCKDASSSRSSARRPRQRFFGLLRGAQQSGRIRQVGVLLGGSESDAAAQSSLAAFRESLLKLGWTEGRNIELDVRWVGADGERRRAYAAEIVGRAPDVIVASPAPEAIAVKQATARIPIVFASGSDPVRNGLVTNLARPEGNVTGFPSV